MIVVKSARLNGMDVRPGQEIDLPDNLVKRWLAAGLVRSAEPKEKPDRKRPNRKKPHEQTVKEPGERAVK